MKYCPKCKEHKKIKSFAKDCSRADGLQCYCHACNSEYARKYRELNGENLRIYGRAYQRKNLIAHNERSKKYQRKEGYCVYKAIYPSGIYVGSGAATERRKSHLAGNTCVGNRLKECALFFEVLFYCKKKECLEVEQLVIEMFGLGNLVNQQNAIGAKR